MNAVGCVRGFSPGDRLASLEAEPVAGMHQEHSQQSQLIFSKYSKEAHLKLDTGLDLNGSRWFSGCCQSHFGDNSSFVSQHPDYPLG